MSQGFCFCGDEIRSAVRGFPLGAGFGARRAGKLLHPLQVATGVTGYRLLGMWSWIILE